MSAPQLLFLAALGAVVVGVAVFGVIVILQADRRVTGRAPYADVARRLARSPSRRPAPRLWAFYAHRISGMAIFAFLALHLVDVALFAVSPALYEEVHVLYGTPPLRVFEVGLFVAILFHAFNGLRLLVIDLVDVGPKVTLALLWLAVGVTAIVGTAGAVVIMRPVFE